MEARPKMDDTTLPPPIDAEAVAESTPSLPLELVHHIIKLSLPPVRFNTFRERYDILLRFALVSKSWTSMAQSELQRHLLSNSSTGYDALKAISQGSDPASVSWHARSVRIGVWQPWTLQDLERIVGWVPRCEELWMRTRYRGKEQELPRLAPIADNLTRLHLDIIPLDYHPRVPTFPSLVELTISEPIDVENSLAFLHETDFPSLRALGLVSWSELTTSPHAQPLTDVLRRLGPRLQRFVLTNCTDFGFKALDLEWSHFTSLDSLAFELPSAGNVVEILRKLPTTLRALRLLPNADGEGEGGVVELLQEWPTAMSTLARLVLFPFYEDEVKAEVETLCAQRGALVEYQDWVPDALETWESLVLCPTSSQSSPRGHESTKGPTQLLG